MLSTKLGLLFATILVGSKILGCKKFIYMTFKILLSESCADAKDCHI